MLTKQEEVRIDNFKAQYNSILSNIQTSNILLGDALAKKTEAEKKLNQIDKEVSSQKSELASLFVLEKKIRTELSNKELALNDRENSLIEKESQSIRDAERRSEEIENKINTVTANITSYKNEELKLKTTVQGLAALAETAKEETLVQVKKMQEARKETTKVERLHKKLENEVNDLTNQYISKEASYEILILKSEEELKRAAQAVALPNKNLQAREEVLLQREKDVQIIIGRLRNIYKERFPEVTFSL